MIQYYIPHSLSLSLLCGLSVFCRIKSSTAQGYMLPFEVMDSAKVDSRS